MSQTYFRQNKIVAGIWVVVAANLAGTTRAQTEPTSRPSATNHSLAAPIPAATSELAAGSPIPTASGTTDLVNLSLEDLMNVEVTSVSKQKQRMGDTPAAVTVITQEDIQRSGMTTLPDLLRLSPGLNVGRFDNSKWAISSRGFNDPFATKLLVMMDGRSVYTPRFAGVLWNQQDYILQDLERIEVVRGPGGTVWGANAVNGVIDIQSKSAQDTQGWLVTGLGGTEQQEGAVRFGGKIDDNTHFRIYTKYRYFDNAATNTGASANDSWQSGQVGFRVDRLSSPNDTLTVQGDVYDQRPNQTAVLPNPMYSFSADGGNLLGRWTHTFSPTSNFALQVYYDRLDRYDAVTEKYQQDTFDIDFHHHFKLSHRQEVTWGAGYRLVDDRDKSRAPGIMVGSRTRDTQIANAFIQDDIAIVPERLHFIAGTKLENNTYTNLEVEPSAKLLWTPDEKHTFWGSISRAIRTPNRIEEDAKVPFTTFPNGTNYTEILHLPNHEAQSEELLAYELGYRFKPTSRLSVDVALFFNDYNKLFGDINLAPYSSNSPSPHLVQPIQNQNVLWGEGYGGELAATWKVTDNWKLIGSYTFLEVQLHRPQGVDQGSEVDQEGRSAQQQIQLRSYLNLTQNIQFNAAAYYTGPLESGPIPAVVRVDANIAWHASEHLDFMVGVQNLLDNHHPEIPSGGTYVLPSETERMFFAQASWRF